jgi:hypothetical protein
MDYGPKLMEDHEPTDTCDQHSTAEGTGLIVPKGSKTIKVWIWASVPKEVNDLWYQWFFTQQMAEEHIAYPGRRDLLVAHTLEPATIRLEQEAYDIKTYEDLEAAVHSWWLDHRGDVLLKMITAPQ